MNAGISLARRRYLGHDYNEVSQADLFRELLLTLRVAPADVLSGSSGNGDVAGGRVGRRARRHSVRVGREGLQYLVHRRLESDGHLSIRRTAERLSARPA